jgi:hypothetical protein
MHTVIRTPVHKREPRHFLVDGLQVWVTCLDTDRNEPFGVRIKWLEHEFSCSPHDHITVDSGKSYQTYTSSWMPNGTVDMRIAETEADPEKLERLGRIFTVYHQQLSEAA